MMILQGIFILIGFAVMISFVRNAQKVEPFTTRDWAQCAARPSPAERLKTIRALN